MTKQAGPDSVVFVIDDDASVRESLKSLFQSVGLQVEMFSSADAFLQGQHPDAACCLVLDVRLPGLSGLEFQNELAKAEIDLPIVFLTGHGDIPMSVQAMRRAPSSFSLSLVATRNCLTLCVQHWSGIDRVVRSIGMLPL